MKRVAFTAVLLGLLVSSASAQAPVGPFRWQKGQVLHYKVEESTSVDEVVGEEKVQTGTKLVLLKRWQVLDVDAAGVATLQMSLTALRQEMVTPNGETMAFDSAAPDKSHPAMREQLSRHVGVPLMTLRVDGQGRVVEVKETKFGSPAALERKPPFVIHLPAAGPQAGLVWQRGFQLVLEPPFGTGQKLPAEQKYACKSADAGKAIITLSTAIAQMPEAAAERLPLLQWLPQGEVVFDTESGRLHSARLQIDQQLAGHQGEGSIYRFQSSYREEYVERP